MQKISSSTTRLHQAAMVMISVMLFVSAANFVGKNLVLALVLAFAGVVAGFVSWAVLKQSAEVYMDDTQLVVRRRGQDIHIPFSNIVSVRKIYFYRRPPIVVAYCDDAGRTAEVKFLPSMRVFGFFFTADEVIERITRRMESTASA